MKRYSFVLTLTRRKSRNVDSTIRTCIRVNDRLILIFSLVISSISNRHLRANVRKCRAKSKFSGHKVFFILSLKSVYLGVRTDKIFFLSTYFLKYWFLCFTLSTSFTGSYPEVKVVEIGGVDPAFSKKGKQDTAWQKELLAKTAIKI